MRKALSILLFTCFALHLHAVDVDYRLGARAAWIMPDGKVDKMTLQQGKWLGPAYSADFSVTFRPDWRALQQWNDAGVGLGFTYWHLPHDLLGQAFAPYAYMDIPLVKRPHFVLGLRPGIGAAFMTKTYQNTVPEGHLYHDLNNANQSIGSVTNLYFPEMLYMDFPIAKGWSVGIAGGWYHISNGSVRQPNSGYNLFAAELALRYSPTQSSIANNQSPIANHPSPIAHRQSPIANNQSPIANSQSPIAKKWSIIAAATASGRQVYYKDQQTFLVGSMHAAAYWHAHAIFHLGGGVDVFYDGAYIPRDTQFQKTNLAAAKAGDCWRIGVSLQPTFVVGDFSLGLHLGAYLHDPVKELEPYSEAILSPTGRLDKPIFYAYDMLNAGSAGYPDGWMYTSVVLRYHLPWHIFLQAMMKSHLTKVEFVSLGIGFYY